MWIYITSNIEIKIEIEMEIDNNDVFELSDITLLDCIMEKIPDFNEVECNVNTIVDELSSQLQLYLERVEYDSIPKEIKYELAVYYSIFHHCNPRYLLEIDIWYFIHFYAHQFKYFQSLVNSNVFTQFKIDYDNIKLLLPE